MSNNVQLIGHLGQDAEVFGTANGGKVANLNLATNSVYTNAQNERITTTHWHRCVVFGKYVEVIETFCKKGSQILLNGELRNRKYTDKNGQEQIVTEILVASVFLISNQKTAE